MNKTIILLINLIYFLNYKSKLKANFNNYIKKFLN